MENYTGEIVQATCESIEKGRVIARFGESEFAFVSEDEWAAKVGDVADVYIDGISKNGLWNGSVDKIEPIRLWQKLEKVRIDGSDIDVKVVACKDNGLVCDVESTLGFMPKSEIEESPVGALVYYVGKTLKSLILKLSEADGTIIVSHKAAIAEELREEREALLTSLLPGRVYRGLIKQIMDYGVFVDIGAGVEGLVHRSNLSWDNADPATLYAIGDKIEVQVISIENGKIALDHKSRIPDSWLASVEKLHIGDIVEGKVTTFANFGAFVKIDKGVEGLVHNSELSWDKNVRSASEVVKLNDCVRVKILGIDKEKRRISLSLRRVDENPWQLFAEKNPVGTRMRCPIVSIMEFGIFVDLGHRLVGLIHRSKLPNLGNDFSLNSIFSVGDPMECVVSSVDVERMRIELELYRDEPDAWQAFIEQNPLGMRLEVAIKRITKFGAFASIGSYGVEGLIHISELSEKRVENVESVVHVGQIVKATIIRIDENKKRVALSLIAEPFEPEEEFQNIAQELENRPTLADIFPKMRK